MTKNSGNEASSSNPTCQSPQNTPSSGPTETGTLIRPIARSPPPPTSQPPPPVELRPTQPPPPAMGVAGVTAFRVVTSSPPETVALGSSGEPSTGGVTLHRPIARMALLPNIPPPPIVSPPPPPPMGVAGVSAFRSLKNTPPETAASTGSSQPTGTIGRLPSLTTTPPRPPAVSPPPPRPMDVPSATMFWSFNKPPSETGGSSGGKMTGSSSGVGGFPNLVFEGTQAISVGGGGSSGGGLSIGAGSSQGRKEVLHNQQPPPLPVVGGLIPYDCVVCGRLFDSERALFGHMRSHPERGWRGARPPPTFRAEEELADMGLNNPPASTEGVAVNDPPAAAGGGAEGVAVNDPPAAAGGAEGVAVNDPPAAAGGAEGVAVNDPPVAEGVAVPVAEGVAAVNNPPAAAEGVAVNNPPEDAAEERGRGGGEEEEENFLLPDLNLLPDLEDD